MERRDLARAGFRPQLRSAADGKQRLAGYAAVFFREGDPGTEYTLGSYPGFQCIEHLVPGCFSSALARPDDVRCLRDHDPSLLLGRTAAGTLRLSVDATGLRFECDLPNTSYAADVKESLARGDLSGSSFSFSILDFTTREQRLPDGTVREIVEIRDLKLFDVSPTSFPAYESTSAGLRQHLSGSSARSARLRRANFVAREAARLNSPAPTAPRVPTLNPALSGDRLRNARGKLARARLLDLDF